jgi:hypothetical protein
MVMIKIELSDLFPNFTWNLIFGYFVYLFASFAFNGEFHMMTWCFQPFVLTFYRFKV